MNPAHIYDMITKMNQHSAGLLNDMNGIFARHKDIDRPEQMPKKEFKKWDKLSKERAKVLEYQNQISAALMSYTQWYRDECLY